MKSVSSCTAHISPFNKYQVKLRWYSGRTLDCGSEDEGSIPSRGTLLLQNFLQKSLYRPSQTSYAVFTPVLGPLHTLESVLLVITNLHALAQLYSYLSLLLPLVTFIQLTCILIETIYQITGL